MEYNKFTINFVLIFGIVIVIFIFIFIKNFTYNQNLIKPNATKLYFNVSETIRLNYEECKNINSSLYINRLFSKDIIVPMCPNNYVVLFDERQNIAFIFNEDNRENPQILTYSVSCNNNTGKC